MASVEGVTDRDITIAALVVRALSIAGFLGSFAIHPYVGIFLTLLLVLSEVWLHYKGGRTILGWFLNRD